MDVYGRFALRASERTLQASRSGSVWGRGLNVLGNSLRGFRRAVFDADRGVRDMDYTLRSVQGTGFNFAYNLEKNFSNFANSFLRLNTIASLLAPLIFTLVGAIVNLVAALVSLASAAAVAAAALGGALLAGIMQLIPVVGLLIAAFHRLGLILQAAKLMTQDQATAHTKAADQAKAHREAIERLADAHYSLSQAYENIRNQTRDIADAERNLIDVRRQAKREIQDSQTARVDAVLAERNATLSLRDAKLQLAELERQQTNQNQLLRDRKSALDQAQRAVEIARVQGDPAQLSMAEQQLGIAQANYSSIQQAQGGLPGQQQKLAMDRAKLGVAQAEQSRKEAQVTLARAIDDANRAERRGVEGAPSVIAAERNLMQQKQQLAAANHNLAKAIREVTDASSDLRNKAYAGANANTSLTNIMGRLDPAEKDTLRIIRAFEKLWNKATQPLTDAIVKAIGKALIQVETLFKDKKFMGAFQNLANVIGDSIVKFSKFLTSPAQKKFFEEFAALAAKNMPKILQIFERVFSLVERIAIAFAPVFEHILGGVDKWLGRSINRADQPANAPAGFQQNRAGAFAARSEKMLDSVSHFFGALFHFLGAVVSVAAGPGKSALDEMAKTFNRWATEITTTKRKGATEFFQNAIKASGEILKLVGLLVQAIFVMTSGPGFDKFIQFLSTTGMQSLSDVGFLFGQFFSALATLAGTSGVNQVLRGFIDLFLASKLIVGVGASVKAMTALFTLLGGKGISLFQRLLGGGGAAGKISSTVGKDAEMIAAEALTGSATALDGSAVALNEAAAALGGAGKVAGLGAGGAAKKVENAGEAAVVAGGRFAGLRQAIYNATGLLIGSGVATGGRIGLVGALGRVGLAGAVIAAGIGLGIFLRKIPFLRTGFDAMGKVIGDFAYDLIHGKYAKALASGFNKVKGAVENAVGGGINSALNVFGLGVKGADKHYLDVEKYMTAQNAFGYAARAFLRNLARNGGDPGGAADQFRKNHENFKNWDFVYQGKAYASGGNVSGGQTGRAVPIVAHVGEWVLNTMQQSRLAQMLGKPLSWIRSILFGGGGGKATNTIFGGATKPMLSNWGDQQVDAAGNPIYAGTYFVETPLGQWVQLSRATIAKMQRQPGWLPRSLLQSTGFQGANADQLRSWSAKMFQRANDPYYQWHTPADRTPAFAAGGVVTTPSATAVSAPARSIPQNFEIHTKSQDVDIGYVMRVAKIHAEGM